jgi:hypothetical protein
MAKFVLFGIDIGTVLSSINWYLVAYIILSIASVVMGTTKLYAMGAGRGVIFAIGASLTFLFFGFRWFSNPVTAPKNWPPTINMCPDYLTYVPDMKGAKSLSGGGCVDLLGVTHSSGGIVKTNPSEVSQISATALNKVFEYTSVDVNSAKTAKQLQVICDRCRMAGLTWEGVYDGDVCSAIKTVDAQNNAVQQCLSLQGVESAFESAVESATGITMN